VERAAITCTETLYLGINRSIRDWFDDQAQFGVKTNWDGTIRGRLGYSTGPAFAYVTGGAAFVNVENSIDDIASGSFASQSEIATGWTVGGGIEAALAQNWTAKTEYLYVDAGSQDAFNPRMDGTPTTAHFDNRFHVFRFGLNYQFGH
jgi:outer membrane immunogenic protein